MRTERFSSNSKGIFAGDGFYFTQIPRVVESHTGLHLARGFANVQVRLLRQLFDVRVTKPVYDLSFLPLIVYLRLPANV